MSFPSLERYVRESRLFHRVVQEWDFCTYREVREFDFDRDHAARLTRPTPLQSAASGLQSKPLVTAAQF